MSRLVTIIAAVALFGSAAHAAPGYVCKMLPLTPDQLRDPTALPAVLASPGGEAIGRASAIVYAVAPERIVSGYEEVIQYNGRRGWVSANRLAPYRSRSNPNAACPPPPWAP